MEARKTAMKESGGDLFGRIVHDDMMMILMIANMISMIAMMIVTMVLMIANMIMTIVMMKMMV